MAPRHFLAPLFALLLCSAAITALPALASEEHTGATLVAPAVNDPRFLPGSTGPVVSKGLAPTVVIPDGPGFGGEQGGRTQNDGDLRKNNYSVTDPNFNNQLGLLPRHPDTGQPLTYVQHIQTYAAVGFIEAFAPHVYAELVHHQNDGEGTVLGAAAHLMGLVSTYDAAAHCATPAMIPDVLPGSPVKSRNYVRSVRDITGQSWARPHHAHTSALVYRMLTEAGVNWSTALVLAGDDGISGSGRLNGVNNQDGTTGLNQDERIVYSLAAQVQKSLGSAHVVHHMMHGHNDSGLHPTSLTLPRINKIVGLADTDRSATQERADLIAAALLDGRVGSAELAANDRFTARNAFLLRDDTDVDLNLDWPSYMQRTGTTLTINGEVQNDGVHLAPNTTFSIALPPQMSLVSATVGGHSCAGGSCSLGQLGYRASLPVTLVVRLRGYGKAKLHASAGSSRAEQTPSDNLQKREVAITTGSSLSVAKRRGKAGKCGAARAKACALRERTQHALSGRLTPASDSGSRWVAAHYYRLKKGRWVRAFERWDQVDAAGRYSTRAGKWDLKRGEWRVQVRAKETWLTGSASSGWSYLRVR